MSAMTIYGKTQILPAMVVKSDSRPSGDYGASLIPAVWHHSFVEMTMEIFSTANF